MCSVGAGVTWALDVAKSSEDRAGTARSARGLVVGLSVDGPNFTTAAAAAASITAGFAADNDVATATAGAEGEIAAIEAMPIMSGGDDRPPSWRAMTILTRWAVATTILARTGPIASTHDELLS